MSNIIYTDFCCKHVERDIHDQLNLRVVRRFQDEDWDINNVMRIITDPSLVLMVLNRINEISIMEISLAAFMCKPILVTGKAIREYPILNRTVDYVDLSCNLLDKDSIFISWYKHIMEPA